VCYSVITCVYMGLRFRFLDFYCFIPTSFSNGNVSISVHELNLNEIKGHAAR